MILHLLSLSLNFIILPYELLCTGVLSTFIVSVDFIFYSWCIIIIYIPILSLFELLYFIYSKIEFSSWIEFYIGRKFEANTNAAFHQNTNAKSAQIVTDSFTFVVHFSTLIVCDRVEPVGGGPLAELT